MNARKGNGIASHPTRNWDKLTELDNSDLVVTGRADLEIGDSLIVKVKAEGEGNKYTTKRLTIVEVLGNHYSCQEAGKTYRESILKADCRYGLGVEKAN